MAKHHVVVDGSNLATEGRTLPSLAQLDEAVRAYQEEDPDAEIVVVVDASFEHRISPDERKLLEQAELHGEVVSPPAGAIGRGDAFVLRIAERTGATVVSNDSFQEFHGEHPWLFDEGRLIGGKPVPGVGWIFTPRSPVRGAKSRKAQGTVAREHEATVAAAIKAAEVAKATKRAAKRAASATAEKATAKKAIAKKAAADVSKDKKVKKAAATKRSARATDPEPNAPPARAAGATKGIKKAAPAKKAAKRLEAPAKATKATKAAKAVKVEKKAKPKKVATTSEPAKANGAVAKAPSRRRTTDRRVQKAIVDATVEALGAPTPKPKAPKSKSGDDKGADRAAKRRRRAQPPPAVNEPLAFITFVATYPIGSVVEGEVASYTSHGAMVEVGLPGGGVLHCYVPLAGLGDPPPPRAREVLARGDRRPFVLIALDPPRRMAELALPDVAAAVSH